jgi:hypothetical protein
MTYTALAVAFVISALLIGSSSSVARRPWLAACLALAMVAAQFALLMST